MSLIGSLLAFVLIPIKPQPKEAENLAVMALADEVRRLTFALDFWRESGHALIEENERLKRQRDTLSAQLRSLANLQGNQFAPYQQAIARQQAQQANLQHQSYQGLGQLQSGCTCVPARAEALRRDPPE